MANVTWTVPNKNGSYDGDYVIKQFTSMTINSGDTVTVDQPCRGLFIYVQGDCTINGTLTMTARGASANPTSSGANDSSAVGSNGIRIGMFTSGGSSTFTNDGSGFAGCGTGVKTAVANNLNLVGNGQIFTIARTGASGGVTPNHGNQDSSRGDAGDNGSGGSLGGGGSGGDAWGNMNQNGTRGGSATCFSGGSGGGGYNGNDSAPNSGAGSNTGGQGGTGSTNHNAICSGGAGNPDGGNADTNGSASFTAANGTGGVIWLVVGGNLTIGASGQILARGVDGRDISSNNGYDWQSTGGGSGGGSIHLLYRGTYTNNGTVSASGGGYGSASHEGYGNGHGAVGGNGGNGSVVTAQIL